MDLQSVSAQVWPGARKPRSCLSWSRDHINLGLLHSLDRGGGVGDTCCVWPAASLSPALLLCAHRHPLCPCSVGTVLHLSISVRRYLGHVACQSGGPFHIYVRFHFVHLHMLMCSPGLRQRLILLQQGTQHCAQGIQCKCAWPMYNVPFYAYPLWTPDCSPPFELCLSAFTWAMSSSGKCKKYHGSAVMQSGIRCLQSVAGYIPHPKLQRSAKLLSRAQFPQCVRGAIFGSIWGSSW